MGADYRDMWQDIGLDLEAHDELLNALNQAYGEIYLTQDNRPRGMQYFDFVMSEVHGLRIKELVEEKKEGRAIIGSYCVFVPEEIVLAGNATLVGLCSAADLAVEKVDKILPRNTCALIHGRRQRARRYEEICRLAVDGTARALDSILPPCPPSYRRRACKSSCMLDSRATNF